MRLGIAISLSIMTDGERDHERDEREGRAKRQATADAAGVQAAPAATTAAGAAGSSSDLFTAPDEDEEDDLYECDGVEGSCLGLPCRFVGAARSQPDRAEPGGGWGYTACCHKPVHFDCLGKWLKPFADGKRKQVDSTRGQVDLNNACCPFCKRSMSSSSRRMLTELEAGA